MQTTKANFADFFSDGTGSEEHEEYQQEQTYDPEKHGKAFSCGNSDAGSDPEDVEMNELKPAIQQPLTQ